VIEQYKNFSFMITVVLYERYLIKLLNKDVKNVTDILYNQDLKEK